MRAGRGCGSESGRGDHRVQARVNAPRTGAVARRTGCRGSDQAQEVSAKVASCTRRTAIFRIDQVSARKEKALPGKLPYTGRRLRSAR